MTAHDARPDPRPRSEEKARIEQTTEGTSTEAVDRARARGDVTLMPAEDFDALLAALDVA